MLELAKLQLVTGDLQSCEYLCNMMVKNEQHKDIAVIVRSGYSSVCQLYNSSARFR